VKLAYRLSHPAIDSGADAEALLLITISAPPGTSTRKPVNLGVALDRSGSMAGEPLAIAKRALGQFVDQLLPDDRLTVIAFDDTAFPVVSAQHATDKAALRAAIASIEPGGTTNLSAGWLSASGTVSKHAAAGTYSRIVLLSDGLANSGILEPEKLADIAVGLGKRGIPTTAIGIGAGYDDEILALIAAQSGGNIHHIDTLDGVGAVLDSEFEELISLYAQNVVIEIAPDASVREAIVLNGYPVTYRAGGFSVACGDIVSGDDRYVLIRFRCGPKSGSQPLTGITLKYHQVAGEVAFRELAAFVSIDRADHLEPTPIDTIVATHLTIVKSAVARRAAAELAEKGDVTSAAFVLGNAASEARAAGLEKDALELERAQASLCENPELRAKEMRTRAWSRSRTRRND
jgi:Ca-activated chloride channel homolog